MVAPGQAAPMDCADRQGLTRSPRASSDGRWGLFGGGAPHPV